METILTPSNIVFVLGLLGVIFGVFRYFKDPQVESEKTDALMKQQLEFFTNTTEKRFQTMQESFNALLLQSNNHIHTVDTKVDRVHSSMEELGRQVVRLGTIIEERIPKK